jgi:hypothetical protein
MALLSLKHLTCILMFSIALVSEPLVGGQSGDRSGRLSRSSFWVSRWNIRVVVVNSWGSCEAGFLHEDASLVEVVPLQVEKVVVELVGMQAAVVSILGVDEVEETRVALPE